MWADWREVVEKCDKCQAFANERHPLAEPLCSLVAPLQYGYLTIDIICKLLECKRTKYIFVLVEYSSKWIKFEALTVITTTKDLFWKSLFCHYGVPYVIVTDNGAHFNNKEVISFAEHQGTRMIFSSLPHWNCQVETLNKIIKSSLKS